MVNRRKTTPNSVKITPRKAIPKAVKDSVWKIHNGNKLDGNCFVCGTVITYSDFDAGHVTARANGGGDDIDNLRPVCRACNGGMKTMNLDEYKAKYYPNVKFPETALGVKVGQKKQSMKQALGSLSIAQLKSLAGTHHVKVLGRIEEGVFEDHRVAPTKSQYVTKLAGVVTSVELDSLSRETPVGAKPKNRGT